MQDMKVQDVPLTRGANFLRNLKRIFANAPRGRQAEVAREAGLSEIHLSRLLKNGAANPTIGTIEAISVAVEVPVETLISSAPSDVDLGIATASA